MRNTPIQSYIDAILPTCTTERARAEVLGTAIALADPHYGLPRMSLRMAAREIALYLR